MFGKPPAHPLASDQDIHDELAFHFDALLDEARSQGLTEVEARQQALARFGSAANYAAQCRAVHRNNLPTVTALSAAALLLAALLGWSSWQLRSLRQERDAALARVESQSEASRANMHSAKLRGRVLDDAGRPLADSQVLVIVKTWPDGGYRQQAAATRTDSRGDFQLRHDIPLAGPYALQVTVFKSGFAFESNYQLCAKSTDLLAPVELRLPMSTRLAVVVQDEQGDPIAGAMIAPSARQTVDGRQHLLYFQNSESVRIASDANGRAELGCFQGGDRAKIYVQRPGRDWEVHAVGIPTDGSEVVLSAANRINDS